MAKEVEVFDKKTFEDALPRRKMDNEPAWEEAGFIGGEYCYLISLGDNKPAKILVRSSVDQTGWSRASGQDSIRVYVVDKNLNPLSGKVNRWTTRLPGWSDRLNEIIRFLALMAIKIQVCPKCKCGKLLRLNKVKKEGENKGRWFIACPESNCFFEWQTQRDNDDDKKDELPECPGCGEKTLNKRVTKKEGKNKGREFYSCSDKECNYFQWVDESD